MVASAGDDQDDCLSESFCRLPENLEQQSYEPKSMPHLCKHGVGFCVIYAMLTL